MARTNEVAPRTLPCETPSSYEGVVYKKGFNEQGKTASKPKRVQNTEDIILSCCVVSIFEVEEGTIRAIKSPSKSYTGTALNNPSEVLINETYVTYNFCIL